MEHTTPAADPTESTLITGVCLVIFTYVFLANAWIGDDAYITFRVVDNFVNGYGLTFNPDERVQAYTHPLWMLLLSAAYAVTSNLFYTTLALSYALCVLALAVVFKSLNSLWQRALFLGVLLSSKGFVDYTSSGLEYPLSFLLLCVFYCRFLGRAGIAASVSACRCDRIWRHRVARISQSQRLDPAVSRTACVIWRGSDGPTHRARLAAYFAIALAPVALWLVFSYVYYGFPFPNTYYAKVATGIPRSLQLRQGLAYVVNSINFDPFTLGADRAHRCGCRARRAGCRKSPPPYLRCCTCCTRSRWAATS